MTWDITDRFPDWGETGESPPTGFFYEGGDQVNEKHLDYLWNSVKGLEDDVQSALNDIDSDGDGTVDQADEVINGLTEDNVVGGNNITISYDSILGFLTISSDVLSAVNAEIDNSATTIAGLDDTLVSHNHTSVGSSIPDSALVEDYSESFDNLTSLNSIISDATLDDNGDARPPETHDNSSHSSNYVVGDENSVVAGQFATNNGNSSSVAIGGSSVSSEGGTSIGSNSTTSAQGATALGSLSTASGDFSTAIGYNSESTNANSGIIGVGGGDIGTDSWEVLGDFTVNGSKNFVIDHPSKPRSHRLKHGAYEGPVAGGLIYNATVNVSNGSTSLVGEIPNYITNGDFGQDWTCHVTANDHFGNGYVDTSNWSVHADTDGEYNITIFGERNDEKALANGGKVMVAPKGETWGGEARSYLERHPQDISEYKNIEYVKTEFDHSENGSSQPCENTVSKYRVQFSDLTKVTVEQKELKTFGPNVGELSNKDNTINFEADVSEIISVAKNKKE